MLFKYGTFLLCIANQIICIQIFLIKHKKNFLLCYFSLGFFCFNEEGKKYWFGSGAVPRTGPRGLSYLLFLLMIPAGVSGAPLCPALLYFPAKNHKFCFKQILLGKIKYIADFFYDASSMKIKNMNWKIFYLKIWKNKKNISQFLFYFYTHLPKTKFHHLDLVIFDSVLFVAAICFISLGC